MFSQEALQRALQERQGVANVAGQQQQGVLPPELMQMLGNQQPAVTPIGEQELDPRQLLMMLMQGQ